MVYNLEQRGEELKNKANQVLLETNANLTRTNILLERSRSIKYDN